MIRVTILAEASRLISGERAAQYGPPERMFALIAALWSAYTGHRLTARDAAVMMALMKIARSRTSPDADTWTDLAGYAALAGELAEAERPEPLLTPEQVEQLGKQFEQFMAEEAEHDRPDRSGRP